MSAVLDSPTVVEADLNYLPPGTPRPVFHAHEPPPGTPWTNVGQEVRRVAIRNARVLRDAHDLTLDAAGFQKIDHVSALAEFSDHDRIRAVYYPEAEALIKRLTGAEKVVIFDHTIRDSRDGARGTALREPARRVHDDQTFVSAPRRVRDHLPAAEAEARLANRFAIINLWRPIGHPVEDTPLALCDARSIAPEDLVPGDLVYRDKVGETYSFLYNPRHSWYYYPRLTPEEALLLKIYDSRTDGTARLTAHTAFDDPGASPDAPPRRSIELRTLVFWSAP